MTVQRRAFARTRPNIGDVKVLDRGNRGVKIGILGDAAANHVIDVPFMAGDLAINKCLRAGLELSKTGNAFEHRFF